MFGTWKYDPETDEVQNLRQAFDPITARSSQHQACNRCHEKKLKCSGEKGGCERCIVNSLQCEYTRSSSRGSRRGKKVRRRSGESEENSPIRSNSVRKQRPTPQTKRSQTGSVSPHRKGSRVPMSSTMPPATTSMPTRGTEGIMDAIDFSLLMPSDGFDLGSLSPPESTTGTVLSSTSAAPTSYMPAVSTMADAPLSMSPSVSPSMSPTYEDLPPHHHLQHTSSFHHPWSISQPAPAYTHFASLSPPAHPNLATAGQGFSASPDQHYPAFHHSQAQHFHHGGYWSDGPGQ